MDQSEFRRWVQSGFGRTILYAREHDVEEFRDLILDACLHCYAYDAQIEGTRADYMLELVALTREKEFYHDEVLKALPGSGDDHDAEQRFRFAACVAFDGNERAKRVMYESYQPGPKTGEGIGINFVQMDGINGLLFAAEKMGALLMSSQEEVSLGWMPWVSSENLGEKDTWDALREAGKTSPRIEAYRVAVEAGKKRLDERIDESRELLGANYEELKPKLPKLGRATFSWIARWGERASDAEFERAAHGLIDAREPKEQRAHLWIFQLRPFPLDIQVLLNLVDVEQERVGFAAMKALAQIVHPNVRELAFRLVQSRAKWRGEAIELLVHNFMPGDHAVVLGWYEAEEDAETRHAFEFDLREFWNRHPDEETEGRMLRALYEKGPCSWCRGNTVRRMIERNLLTEEMRTECAYDANDDIRDLVKASSDRRSY
jgi:hypothetical protein